MLFRFFDRNLTSVLFCKSVFFLFALEWVLDGFELLGFIMARHCRTPFMWLCCCPSILLRDERTFLYFVLLLACVEVVTASGSIVHLLLAQCPVDTRPSCVAIVDRRFLHEIF